MTWHDDYTHPEAEAWWGDHVITDARIACGAFVPLETTPLPPWVLGP